MLKLKNQIKNMEKIVTVEVDELVNQINTLKNNVNNAKYLLLVSTAFFIGVRISGLSSKKMHLYFERTIPLLMWVYRYAF